MLFLSLHISDCGDGDVSFHDSDPLVFWQGEFVRICGDIFWDSNDGAELFCKKLGYESGFIQKVPGSSASTSKALQVGRCTDTDISLAHCTGAFNTRYVGPFKDCTLGHTYNIICSGGTEVSKASCTPGN